MRRRWAAQATQRQAESSAAAVSSLPAPPCIDLSTQTADPIGLPPAFPDALDYGDASPASHHGADIAPTQLDSPCISVSSTEDVELVPPAPPTHTAVLRSLAASSKHPAHHVGADCPAVPKALTHGPLPTVADLAIPPPVLRTSPARLAMYPSSCPALSHCPNPAPQKRTRTSPPLRLGGLSVPAPPAAPLSLTQPQRQQATALPRPVATQSGALSPASLGPRLKPPAHARCGSHAHGSPLISEPSIAARTGRSCFFDLAPLRDCRTASLALSSYPLAGNALLRKHPFTATLAVKKEVLCSFLSFNLGQASFSIELRSSSFHLCICLTVSRIDTNRTKASAIGSKLQMVTVWIVDSGG